MAASINEAEAKYKSEEGWNSLMLDHFVLYCDDLEKAINHIENLTGVRPVFGGKHIGNGTHNAFLSLVDNNSSTSGLPFPPIYLALLAKDPDQAEFGDIKPRLSFNKHSSLRGKIVHWAALTPRDQLPDYVEKVNSNAAWSSKNWPELGQPLEIEGNTPDNQTIRWILSVPVTQKPLPGDGLLPYLTDWQDTILDGLHPGQTSPKGIVLKAVTLRHPNWPMNVQTGLDNFGLLSPDTNGGIPITVEQSMRGVPEIILHLTTPNGDVELSEF